MIKATIAALILWGSAYLPLQRRKDQDGIKLVVYCLLGSIAYGLCYNYKHWGINNRMAINSCLWFLCVFGGLVTTCIQVRVMTNKETQGSADSEPYDALIEDE